MKKDFKYIAILVSCALLYIVMELITPKPINWKVTLASLDKNPFGAYLLNERMQDLFASTTKSNQTIYELKDSSINNFFILSQNFSPSQEDTDALLTKIHEGNNALIVSNYFLGPFADTLNIGTADYLFEGDLFENINREDTSALSFTNPQIRDQKFYYQRNNSPFYFNKFDSLEANVLGLNDLDRATFIRIPWGKGTIFLSSTPLVFTNNYMVYADNYNYVSNVLSYLPKESIHWTEFYQLGRLEARTPLRFILSTESLKWAYFITLISLILFIIFEAKRKQRIIPVITPLRNDTLDFIGTIGNLYYQNKAHKSIALKKINFFTERLRSHYYLNVKEDAPDFVTQVAQKTGNDKEEVQALFDLINRIRAKTKIEEKELLQLNKKIENFKLN